MGCVMVVHIVIYHVCKCRYLKCKLHNHNLSQGELASGLWPFEYLLIQSRVFFCVIVFLI